MILTNHAESTLTPKAKLLPHSLQLSSVGLPAKRALYVEQSRSSTGTSRKWIADPIKVLPKAVTTKGVRFADPKKSLRLDVRRSSFRHHQEGLVNTNLGGMYPRRGLEWKTFEEGFEFGLEGTRKSNR